MMDGFGLLIGHLIGDYILQNDWMASNKTNTLPGKGNWDWWPDEGGGSYRWEGETVDRQAWERVAISSREGHLACTVHCILYTLAVWAFSFWWMPWWGLVACFVIHWPVDRFRLARWWMVNVSGQEKFATGILSPWSIIIVDNTFHLLTLFVIGVFSGRT